MTHIEHKPHVSCFSQYKYWNEMHQDFKSIMDETDAPESSSDTSNCLRPCQQSRFETVTT